MGHECYFFCCCVVKDNLNSSFSSKTIAGRSWFLISALPLPIPQKCNNTTASFPNPAHLLWFPCPSGLPSGDGALIYGFFITPVPHNTSYCPWARSTPLETFSNLVWTSSWIHSFSWIEPLNFPRVWTLSRDWDNMEMAYCVRRVVAIALGDDEHQKCIKKSY